VSDDAARMKARLRDDLRAAMKARRPKEARLLRTLVAAIDHAEAPPVLGRRMPGEHRFLEGTAEVERLCLGPDQVRAVLMAEIREREAAAAEMSRLARPDLAEALRAEALLARRYVE
jgi:uncharacterized protein YqeY